MSECVSAGLCQGRRETVIYFFLRKISLLTSSEILCSVIWATASKGDQTCQKMFLSAKFVAWSLSVPCVHFFDYPPVQLPCLTGLTHNSECSCWVNFLFSLFLSSWNNPWKEEWVVHLLLLSKPALWCWCSNRDYCGLELSTQTTRNSTRYFSVTWHFLC